MAKSVKVDVDHETGEVIEVEDLPGSMEDVDPIQVVSKLSIAQIGCNPTLAKMLQKRVPMAVFAGRCTDTKQVEDPQTHKMFTALVGAFTAVNFQSGHRFKSGVLYLPDAFQNYVIAALEHSREQPTRRGMSAFRGIEFTYQVDAKPDSNPIGYSYVMRSLMAATAADPTDHLLNNALKLLGLAPGQPLALPAPEAA
jgi:hypothetical protein